MRRAIIIVFLLFTTAAWAEDGWFAYYFPADPAKAPDYQGVPASVFNAGKDVLDAPAGKHGFVKVKDGHFYFEDGTRARFWGTNLCFDACFPDKKNRNNGNIYCLFRLQLSWNFGRQGKQKNFNQLSSS